MRRRVSKEPKPFQTWVIRNKITGEFFVAPSGKNSWKASNHAKNAWASIGSGYWYGSQEHLYEALDNYQVSAREYRDKPSFPYFDEQAVWELVNLSGSVEQLGIRLKIAENILKDLLNNYECGEKVDNMIQEYFNIE